MRDFSSGANVIARDATRLTAEARGVMGAETPFQHDPAAERRPSDLRPAEADARDPARDRS